VKNEDAVLRLEWRDIPPESNEQLERARGYPRRLKNRKCYVAGADDMKNGWE
jgi:hypothetical protein